MDAESPQTSTKFYLNDPKFITLSKPSGESNATMIQTYQCGYIGCSVTVGRKHDLITRHWPTHFPLADGEGTRCYYCGHVTRQRANMKTHEQRCPLAPHNLVAPVGLQRAQRRPRTKKTEPPEKTTAPSAKKAATASTKGRTTASTKEKVIASKKVKEKQTAAHDAHDMPSDTYTQVAIIHRSAVDDFLPDSVDTAQRALDTIRAERKRRRESEAGLSKRPERRRKLDATSERRAPAPTPNPERGCTPPLPPQTMGISPRPALPTPRRARRRTATQKQTDIAHPSGSTSHAPLIVDTIPDARTLEQRAHYMSDERRLMGGSRRTPQMPASGAYCPPESSAMGRQRGAYRHSDGMELASTSVGTARAEEPWGEGESRAVGALDFAAMQWPPPEQQPIAAAAYPAAQQGPSRFSGWEYVEPPQVSPPRGVESLPAVDGPFYAPPYEADHSPADNGTVAPSAITLPSLPAVMATLAGRPEFERDVAGQSGRNHWRAAPVAWSPIPDWQQGHDAPVHPSTNNVDTFYADGVAPGTAPMTASDPAQSQYPNYSAHTLVRRGSSSSGSSNGGGTVLMTPPDHAADTVLQPESYYYGNASGYGASRNAGIAVVDPPQALMADPNYFASAGYTGQPYYEMGSNYGYDT